MMAKKKQKTIKLKNGNATAEVVADQVPLWEKAGWLAGPSTTSKKIDDDTDPEGDKTDG